MFICFECFFQLIVLLFQLQCFWYFPILYINTILFLYFYTIFNIYFLKQIFFFMINFKTRCANATFSKNFFFNFSATFNWRQKSSPKWPFLHIFICSVGLCILLQFFCDWPVTATFLFELKVPDFVQKKCAKKCACRDKNYKIFFPHLLVMQNATFFCKLFCILDFWKFFWKNQILYFYVVNVHRREVTKNDILTKIIM